MTISATPRPLKKHEDASRKRAGVLYRALLKAGPTGLSWAECFAVLGADTVAAARDESSGPSVLVVWMRSKGVGITCSYEDQGHGFETRFVLG